MATNKHDEYVFPAFDELHRVEGAPLGCLWGFYDHNGVKDQVGSINLLTPAVVQAASSEIRTGRHVQLDWPLDSLSYPGFGRKTFEQKVISLKSRGTFGFDDELYINTQSGSQWDSLKHHAAQKQGVFYNGLTFEKALESKTNGIHNWCERGGIVGRGILVDMPRYYEISLGKSPHAFTRHEITVKDLQSALADQGTVPRQGDIFLVRTGFIRDHNAASPEERSHATQKQNTFTGLQANEQTIRWLYSQHFAALVGDTVALEAWPPNNDEWIIHEWALTWWGTPIGEMWDLENLAAECERQKRWSFFLTSAPLHVKGGVASPPGAIAIF